MHRVHDVHGKLELARAALDRAQRRNQALGRLKPTDADERIALRDALLASIARVQRAKLRFAAALRDLQDIEHAEARRREDELTIIEDRRGEPWAMVSNPHAAPWDDGIMLPELVA